MSVGRWHDGEGSQEFTQATQEEPALELDEYTQVEPVAETRELQGSTRNAEPLPWGRLMRLAGGAVIPLMPRPEQTQGRALNEVMLGRSKVCEVQITDRRISSKHCRIFCEAVSGHLGGFEVYVEDMSANGTWINQTTKLARGGRRLLNSGDEVALLNPYKPAKKADTSGAGRDAGEDGERLLEVEDATFTFINLDDRNRGLSHGRVGSLSVAETLQAAGTVPGVSSPVLRSSASGVSGMFGGARKVEDLYELRERIGEGTSGVVRRAINRVTGKQVAVKVIETRKFALTPGLTPKELVQEAEMLKRVNHEYIIKLEDIFQTDQAVYLVMDLVSGGDLFDRIVDKGLYPEHLAQELLFRVLTAVEYLHSQDIVHRDLKPENILLVGPHNDVDVKITDFGLAKRANKEGLKTFCGTPQYFAPEVLKRRNTVLGVGRYGKEADMWSVGVILYILLSGTHPFHTTTLFDQITHASYSLTGKEWEHISSDAKDLVSRLLTESPKARLTAEQALAHPFITKRAGAAQSSKDASVSAQPDGTRGHKPSADGAAAGGESGQGRGHGGTGATDRVAVARSSSQDTDISTTSAEDAPLTTSKSLSPADGGGGSAKAAPGGLRGSSPEKALPARPAAPNLPPPQPREPIKGGGGDRGSRGGGGGGGGRRRSKKDGASDKPPNPYSQLQMHLVGGSDGGVGCSSQETAEATAKGTSRESNGFHPMSASVTDGAASSARNGKGAGGGCSHQGNAKERPGSSTQAQSPVSTSMVSNGRGKRKAPGVGHVPQCPSSAAASAVMGRPRSRRSTDSAVDDSTADLTSDDIMDYSSDDSPTKMKRGRGVGSGDQGTVREANLKTNKPQPTPTAGNGAGGTRGGQQMLLKVGDGGKLDLAKLAPSSRAGVGSAGHANSSGAGPERPSGDRVAQATAGGGAATAEESVGGGAPAGSGNGAASAASGGKGGKASKQTRGGSKPQRTMTHLWKQRAVEGAP